MPTQPHHTRWSDITPEPMNPLLTRQLVWGDQAMISRIELKKGCIVPLHSHPNEQIAYITVGLMRFTLGLPGATTEYLLHPEDLLVIPGNVPHMAEALEDSINFDLFAPPRQDWINKEDSYLRG